VAWRGVQRFERSPDAESQDGEKPDDEESQVSISASMFAYTTNTRKKILLGHSFRAPRQVRRSSFSSLCQVIECIGSVIVVVLLLVHLFVYATIGEKKWMN
jgi:hypothetical protein